MALGAGPQAKEITDIRCPDIPEWNELKRLAFEKETVGFYITGHPLDDALAEIRTVVDSDIDKLAEWGDEQPVRVGGLIRTCKRLQEQKGRSDGLSHPRGCLRLSRGGGLSRDLQPLHRASLDLNRTGDHPGRMQKDERGVKIIADSIDLLPGGPRKIYRLGPHPSRFRQDQPAETGGPEKGPLPVPWPLPGPAHPPFRPERRSGCRGRQGSDHQALPGIDRPRRGGPWLQGLFLHEKGHRPAGPEEMGERERQGEGGLAAGSADPDR